MIKYPTGVYCLTSPSGKRYVGIGMGQRGIEGRWRIYRRMGATLAQQPALHSALRKYGPDNFKYEVVLATANRDRASALERQLIALWNLTNPDRGYNLAEGGLAPKGYTHHTLSKEELSQKLSLANKKAWGRRKARGPVSNKLSEQALVRRRAGCKKRAKPEFSEDALRRIREAATGRPSSLKGKTLPSEILLRRLGPDGKLLPAVAAKHAESYARNRERNSQILKEAWAKRRAEGKVPGPLPESAKAKLRAFYAAKRAAKLALKEAQ